MRRRAWMWTLVGLVSCGAAGLERDATQDIVIAGSDSLTSGLIPILTAAYGRGHPDVAFTIDGAGNTPGIERLLEGEADIVASSRPASPHEEEQARENGYNLTSPRSRHIIGVDVVALAVHPANPTDSLTYDQVIGIFCTRSIDNWSYLGLEDQPIRTLTLDPASGTRALFEDFFCGPRGIHPAAEQMSADNIERTLRSDPSAITYLSLAAQVGKVLGLRPDASGPPVRPSQQNIIRGAYPLYHDVYLFTPGPPSGFVADFIRWIDSPSGQELVDEARFVPLFLRPERLDEARPLRETIHFEPGAVAPNQRSSARLQLLVAELRERAGEYRHIVLEGYTDDQEPDPMALSAARAEGVHDLLQKDLPGTYFEIIPRGAMYPIAPNDTPYGRNRNRRVQVYLAGEERSAPATPPAEGGG